MNKFKTIMLCILYVMMAIVSIPFVMIGLICVIAIYAVLKIEVITLQRIEDDEITNAWNRTVELLHDIIDSINKLFLMEMGL